MPTEAAWSMTHDELQRHVAALCGKLGLLHFNFGGRRGVTPGWPDSTILSRRGIIFRELKTERGSLEPEQRVVGYMLVAAEQNWAVWRPTDWLDGNIENELSRIA
jgi:hypothetical protein